MKKGDRSSNNNHLPTTPGQQRSIKKPGFCEKPGFWSPRLIVNIRAIGVKERNQVIISGEVVDL